jgi:membrane protein
MTTPHCGRASPVGRVHETTAPRCPSGRRAGDPKCRRVLRHGCLQRAAAISYFAVLSLFPLAILAVAVFGLVFHDHGVRDRIIDFLLDNLPLRRGEGRAQLRDVLTTVTGEAEGFGAVGAVGLLFAASGVMGAVRQALNAAWDVRDPRPPVQAKLVDIALVVGFGLLIAASFGLTLGVRLVNELGSRISGVGAIGRVVAVVLLDVGQLAPALLTFLTVIVLFSLVPAAEARPRSVWPGALVVAVGFELAKTGFALYLTTAGGYGAVYASLATVVAFMVFVYLAANILLLGGEMASEWPALRSAAREQDARRGAGPSAAARVGRALRGLFVRPGA